MNPRNRQMGNGDFVSIGNCRDFAFPKLLDEVPAEIASEVTPDGVNVISIVNFAAKQFAVAEGEKHRDGAFIRSHWDG